MILDHKTVRFTVKNWVVCCVSHEMDDIDFDVYLKIHEVTHFGTRWQDWSIIKPEIPGWN